VRRCPRCQRANPPDAAYCHDDGIPLDTIYLPSMARFARAWRFPNGREARTVDEFAEGCLVQWNEARSALVRRDFNKFFDDIGRADLARLVPPAEPDAELALHTFLEKLPTMVKVAPTLDVAPRRIHVADARRGEERRAFFTIVNRGTGLLTGDLAVADGGNWLRVSTPRVRARTDQPVELVIDTKALPEVGSYFTRVQVRTNGGAVEVPVQVDLAVRGIPFQGTSISDPHDLAKLMMQKPKLAGKWMAEGVVKRLFEVEGWAYPLTGRLAPSLGAVQQYFEAMKLSHVPTVTPDATEFDVVCEWPESTTRAVTLSANSKKWVYAFVESGALWLKPHADAVAGGRQVDVVFDVDSEMMEPGRIHEGVLQITANGGQEFSVLVRVDVRRPHEPWTRKILKPFAG
jgi:hypothetical protein